MTVFAYIVFFMNLLLFVTVLTGSELERRKGGNISWQWNAFLLSPYVLSMCFAAVYLWV